jgi:hypothetical protein
MCCTKPALGNSDSDREQLYTAKWRSESLFCCSFLASLHLKANVQTARPLRCLSQM